MNQILVCSILPQFVDLVEIEGDVVVDADENPVRDMGTAPVAGDGDFVVPVAADDYILSVLHVIGAHVLKSAQLNTE